MTTWLLILIVSSTNNIAITHVDIESEVMCISAGEKLKHTQNKATTIDYVCVKGWEITND